jgi:hypothetical protein
MAKEGRPITILGGLWLGFWLDQPAWNILAPAPGRGEVLTGSADMKHPPVLIGVFLSFDGRTTRSSSERFTRASEKRKGERIPFFLLDSIFCVC